MKEISTLWTAQELAVRLRTTRGTINTMRWQIRKGVIAAHRLPPCLSIGGRPRWDPDQVEAWLRTSSDGALESMMTKPKLKPGRKRIATTRPIRLL